MLAFTVQYYLALAIAFLTLAFIILAGLPLQIFAVPLVAIVLYLLWMDQRVTQLHQQRFAALLSGMRVEGDQVRFTALGGMSETTFSGAALQQTLQAHRKPSLWFGFPVTSTVQGDPVSLHILTSGETTILNFRKEEVSYRVMLVTDDLTFFEEAFSATVLS